MTKYFTGFLKKKTYPGHLRLSMNRNKSIKAKTNTNASIVRLQRIAGNSFRYGCYFQNIYFPVFEFNKFNIRVHKHRKVIQNENTPISNKYLRIESSMKYRV